MRYLYVANWKMNMSVSKSTIFCSQNYNTLQQLSADADIVLCPSFIALIPVIEALKNNPVAIGAQNCSEYSLGAYTGEVSALSLTEIGVKYCIVGHSERRMLYHETTEAIIKKIYLLYAANIVPIICIEETTTQLEPILSAIAEQQEHSKHLIIAYEPTASIGTGIIPTPQQLVTVFTEITEQIKLHLPEHTIQLLYGGSVSKDTIKELKKTPLINGFLIGGASTDFEQFNDIING